MATIVKIDNPLTLQRKIFKDTSIEEYLFDDCIVLVNGVETTNIDELTLDDDDIITIYPNIKGGNDSQRLLLSALITAGAIYTGGWAAGALGFAEGSLGAALTQAVVMSTLIYTSQKLLLPPDSMSGEAIEERYRLNKSENAARFGQLIPVVCGTIKHYPDISSRTYIEYAGKQQYLYQIYTFAQNEVSIDVNTIKVGDTPLTDLVATGDIEYQLSGQNGVIDLFPANVDTAKGKNLTTLNDSLIVTTGSNTTRISVDIEFLLYRLKKGKYKKLSMEFKIEYRLVGSTQWETFSNGSEAAHILKNVQCAGAANHPTQSCTETPVITNDGHINIENSSPNPFIETFTRSVPSGQYEVKITRLNRDHRDDSTQSHYINVLQVRSYQPDVGLYQGQTRLAIKARASANLQGTLQQVSAIVNGQINSVTTSNPADWFIYFCKRYNNYTDNDLDIAGLQQWRAFCSNNNLHFNHAFTRQAELGEVLSVVARAGRASISYSTGKLGVTYIEPSSPVIQHFSNSNIIEDSYSISLITAKKLTGVTVEFFDEDNDYKLSKISKGVEPFQIVQIPGITNKVQANEECNLIYNNLVKTKSIVSFATNTLGCIVNKNDKITVDDGLTGVGTKTIRVLGVEQKDSNTVVIHGREDSADHYTIDAIPVENEQGYQIFGYVDGIGKPDNTPNNTSDNPSYWERNSTVAKQINIKIAAVIIDGRLYLTMNWENIQCTGVRIEIQSSISDKRTYDVFGTSARFSIDYETRLYQITFTPLNTVLNPANPYQTISIEQTTIEYQVDKANISTNRFVPDVPTVSGLRLTEGFDNPNIREFVGKHCSIAWNHIVSNSFDLKNTAYGFSNEDDSSILNELKFYQVKVYNVDDRSNPLFLGLYTVTDNQFTFLYEENVRKSAQYGKFPTRNLKFEVHAVTRFNQISEQWARLYANNPVPLPVQNINLIPMYKSIGITYETSFNDTDMDGIVVWMHTAPFTPSGKEVGEGTCVYKGRDTNILIPNLTPGTTYYFYVAAYDVFGFFNPYDLNLSSQLSATVSPIESSDIGQGAITAFNLANSQLITNSTQIAGDIVTDYHIIDQGITEQKLADGSVNSIKLNVAAIDSSTGQIAPDAVGNNQLQSNSVDSGVIATNAVNSDHITSDAVDTPHILDGATSMTQQGYWPLPSRGYTGWNTISSFYTMYRPSLIGRELTFFVSFNIAKINNFTGSLDIRGEYQAYRVNYPSNDWLLYNDPYPNDPDWMWDNRVINPNGSWSTPQRPPPVPTTDYDNYKPVLMQTMRISTVTPVGSGDDKIVNLSITVEYPLLPTWYNANVADKYIGIFAAIFRIGAYQSGFSSTVKAYEYKELRNSMVILRR